MSYLAGKSERYDDRKIYKKEKKKKTASAYKHYNLLTSFFFLFFTGDSDITGPKDKL